MQRRTVTNWLVPSVYSSKRGSRGLRRKRREFSSRIIFRTWYVQVCDPCRVASGCLCDSDNPSLWLRLEIHPAHSESDLQCEMGAIPVGPGLSRRSNQHPGFRYADLCATRPVAAIPGSPRLTLAAVSQSPTNWFRFKARACANGRVGPSGWKSNSKKGFPRYGQQYD
jgi:hypothetical protein